MMWNIYARFQTLFRVIMGLQAESLIRALLVHPASVKTGLGPGKFAVVRGISCVDDGLKSAVRCS